MATMATTGIERRGELKARRWRRGGGRHTIDDATARCQNKERSLSLSTWSHIYGMGFAEVEKKLAPCLPQIYNLIWLT